MQLSPIDLIPDFIPVLGYADDLIIVPLGIWLVVSLIPSEVMAECRAKADAAEQRPRSTMAAVAIIAIWVGAAAMLGWAGFTRWRRSRLNTLLRTAPSCWRRCGPESAVND